MAEEEKKAAPVNFIRQIIDADLASGKVDHVVTRFPPEPNGYLHIGHAKSICLNFGIAQDYHGKCNLRFDDTNPAKEGQEYVDSIKRDVEWLGFKWDGEPHFSSDYFDRLYGFAIELINKGLAYVDELSPDEIREYRGTLTEPGKNSPYRDRSVEENLALFEKMKANNPRRYAVAGLGGWGIVDGLVYENWKEQPFELISKADYLLLDEAERTAKDWVFREDVSTRCGLDFGYTNDPTASPIMFLDIKNSRLYIWDELYETGLANRKIYERLCSMGYGKELYTADSAEPKSIDELRYLGMRVKGAKKGRDSISNGIQWIQNLQIIVHPRCVNFLTEISNYSWDKDKFGKKLNAPIDSFNHLMDAMRYGLESDIIGCPAAGINRNTDLRGGF